MQKEKSEPRTFQIDSSVQLLKPNNGMSNIELAMWPENERNVEICDGTEILGRDY